jgi:hypothetical protein
MSTDDSIQNSLRPRDLATLLLASGDLLPRQRARDQQADTAGGELKRRVLERVATLDPEPSDLVPTLDRIIEEIGEPTGPTRAIATGIREEFEAVAGAPQLLEWLLARAAERSTR